MAPVARRGRPWRGSLRRQDNIDSGAGPSTSSSSLNGGSATGTVLSPSSGSGTAGSKAPEERTEYQYKLEAVAFERMIQSKNRKLLVFDCRDAIMYNRKWIPDGCCIALSGPSRTVTSINLKLDSKSAVVNFFGKCDPMFPFDDLQVPGHYDHVVVFDERSIDDVCSDKVKLVLEALTKWTEASKTTLHILQGGYDAFARNFPLPSVVDIFGNPAPPPPTRQSPRSRYADVTRGSSPIDRLEMENHLMNQDETIWTIKTMISLCERSSIVTGIRSKLLTEEGVDLPGQSILKEAFKKLKQEYGSWESYLNWLEDNMTERKWRSRCFGVKDESRVLTECFCAVAKSNVKSIRSLMDELLSTYLSTGPLSA